MTCRSDLSEEWFADYLARAVERPLRQRVLADGLPHGRDWVLERQRAYDEETDLLREALRLTRPYGRGIRHDTAAKVRMAAARLVSRVDFRSVS